MAEIKESTSGIFGCPCHSSMSTTPQLTFVQQKLRMEGVQKRGYRNGSVVLQPEVAMASEVSKGQ